MNGFSWVEPDWAGQTVAIIAGGPSVTPAQVERVRGLRTVAVNDAYRLAPWADVLYFCDPIWWSWHREALRDRKGLIVRLESPEHDGGDPRVRVLKNYGKSGFIDARDGVMTGQNSGYQALHYVVHRGAATVLLLGFDCRYRDPQRRHWFGNHPNNSLQPVEAWIQHFQQLAPELAARGVRVVNCSPDSALTCFEKADIESVLPRPAAAALSA